jgi:hypothetical protein
MSENEEVDGINMIRQIAILIVFTELCQEIITLKMSTIYANLSVSLKCQIEGNNLI